MNLYGESKVLFNQMDKFQHWVASQDVPWAHTIRLYSLMTLKLMPIQHLVKEFL
jgi:hypothetical protein